MRITLRFLFSFLALAWVGAEPSVLTAQEEHVHQGPAGAPAGTVEAFHQALAGGDRQAVLALLAQDAVIFESGGAEMSPAEYAHHHLAGDMAFTAATEREIVDRQVRENGHVAWVLTRTETRGSFRGRDVASRGTETMVLVRGEGGWRIAHIHWSSNAAEEE